MNFFLRPRTHGLTIRMNTPEDRVISWNGDEVQYGSVRFTIPQLRGIVHGLVESTRNRLYRNLLLLDVDKHGALVKGSTPLPKLDLNALYDNPSAFKEGWSFLQDSRNTFEVDGRT